MILLLPIVYHIMVSQYMDFPLVKRLVLRWRLSYFRKQRIAWWTSVASVLVIVVNFAALWFYPENLDPFLPLHYTAYFGVDYLGTFNELLYVPLLGLCIALLNTILARSLARRQYILACALTIASLTVQFIILIFLVTTILRF